jgi:hypothetical protein
MMLTMAMPAAKRSDLIMAVVPIFLIPPFPSGQSSAGRLPLGEGGILLTRCALRSVDGGGSDVPKIN